MSDKPVREVDEPTADSRDDSAPGSIGVYDRPPEADRRISPVIIGVIAFVVLILLAILALAILF